MKIKNSMRQTLRPKLVDYIKAAGIPFYPPEIFDCPACGFTASLLPGGLWRCPCGKHGDIVDLAMLAKGYDTEQEAVKAICRLLHIKITQMPIISAEELMDTEFPVSNYLIEKLMGKGLYILAGPPKVGKSWLVLWMAHCISLGLPLWQLQTTQNGVLYVSLEDTPQRIQQRLDKISGGETGDIWFATEAELVGNGLEEQLTNLLKEHLTIRFIVIDTLQRVRPSNGEQYNYGADYDVMCSLKQIADRFGITILAVHHTRKQKSDDAFERISGTTGLMGSADGALVLQKHSRVAQEVVLDVTGRDVPDLRLRLMFDREKSIWRFIGYEGEEPTEYREPLLEAISAFVKKVQSWEGTATELLEQLGLDLEVEIKPNVLTRRLKANAQALRETYGIQYSGSTRTASSRIIRLSLIKQNDDDDGNDDILKNLSA